MPQFELDLGSREAFDRFFKLDAFTQSYIEAMYWTDCNCDSEELSEATFEELAPTALQTVIDDCADFQSANAPLLERAREAKDTYDDYQAGHDFWLTRNGHGCGFWDRGLGKVGDELTANSKPYGAVNLYRGDDGKVHV
jgi:hypothetical protein